MIEIWPKWVVVSCDYYQGVPFVPGRPFRADSLKYATPAAFSYTPRCYHMVCRLIFERPFQDIRALFSTRFLGD